LKEKNVKESAIKFELLLRLHMKTWYKI
jgi:hypothetical protein